MTEKVFIICNKISTGGECMDNTIQISIRITTKDMFFFMFQHTYRSISGVCGLLFSVISFVALIRTWGTVDTSYSVILAISSALFTIVNPLMLYTRSARQVALNPAMKIPITYTFGELEFTMRQGKEEAKARYHDLYQIRNTKNYIYLYGTGTRANIIPKGQLGKQAQAVMDMVMKGYQQKE